MASDRDGDGPIAVITVSHRRGREYVDSEVPVGTLRELYDACRQAAAGALVKVLLRGPEGEVRLNFGSYIDQRKR